MELWGLSRTVRISSNQGGYRSSNDITKAARALSFDAVLVEKLAYTEGDLAALRSNIVDAQIVFEDNERILYTIKQP